MSPAIKSLGLGAGKSWYSRTQASRRVMNSAGAISSPNRFREGTFWERSSLADVDNDCLGDELRIGDPFAADFVLVLGTADFRGFGVALAPVLDVVLALGGTVLEPGSEASQRVCAIDEISVGPSLGPMAVSGCCCSFSAMRSRVSVASASVLATGLVVIFIFLAGLVLAAVRSWGMEQIAASGFGAGVRGFVGFVAKGSTLLGGSIWLRLNGAVEERSR